MTVVRCNWEQNRVPIGWNSAGKGLSEFIKVDTCVSGYVTDMRYKFRETVGFAMVKALHMYLEEVI